jgi:hypothetical protein
VGIGGRNAGAEDAVSPVGARGDIVEGEAEVKAVAALEVDEGKDFECDEAKSEHDDNRTDGAEADEPFLRSAAKAEVFESEDYDAAGESQQHKEGGDVQRKEAADEYRGDSGNGNGEGDAPEEALDEGTAAKAVKISEPGSQISGTDGDGNEGQDSGKGGEDLFGGDVREQDSASDEARAWSLDRYRGKKYDAAVFDHFRMTDKGFLPGLRRVIR